MHLNFEWHLLMSVIFPAGLNLPNFQYYILNSYIHYPLHIRCNSSKTIWSRSIWSKGGKENLHMPLVDWVHCFTGYVLWRLSYFKIIILLFHNFFSYARFKFVLGKKACRKAHQACIPAISWTKFIFKYMYMKS